MIAMVWQQQRTDFKLPIHNGEALAQLRKEKDRLSQQALVVGGAAAVNMAAWFLNPLVPLNSPHQRNLKMSKPSQLGLFEALLQPKLDPKSARRQPKAALKITSPSIQAKVKVQPDFRLESESNLFSTSYGHCRICGSWIAIPGLDASLCSHSVCGQY